MCAEAGAGSRAGSGRPAPPSCGLGVRQVAFGRGQRPRAAAGLRSGRIGRPSRAETGRCASTVCGLDALDDLRARKPAEFVTLFAIGTRIPGGKGPGRAPPEGGAPRFPRSGSLARREPWKEGRSKAPICVPIVESVTKSGRFHARSARRARQARPPPEGGEAAAGIPTRGRGLAGTGREKGPGASSRSGRAGGAPPCRAARKDGAGSRPSRT